MPPFRTSSSAPLAGMTRFIREFTALEAAGGIVLMAAAALALVIANSPLASTYFAAKATYVGPLTVDYWVNDGLMAVFFLLVGLEVKREFLVGELASWEQRILPGVAAIAGIVTPALLYILIAGRTLGALDGWAIPAATDIAFALGVLALLGSRAPASLKVLLTAIAVIDDITAVVIIALFYTAQVALLPLMLAVLALVVLIVLNRRGVTSLWPYMVIGALVWVAVLNSGVHATLAGVAVALTVPIGRGEDAAQAETGDGHHSPLHRLEHGLHPLVAFGVLPIFGFANAGVSFAGLSPASLLAPVPLGIASGLFVGKQVGIMAAAALVIRAGWANLPTGAGWRQMYGLSLLCGIGFTMSLFIGALAFTGPDAQDAVKLGVLTGSILSAFLGFLVLRTAKPSAVTAE